MTKIDVKADPRNMKYIAEFNAQPLFGKSMTLEEYVASRRIDDGIDQLEAGNSNNRQKSGDTEADLTADDRNLPFIREFKAQPAYAKSMTVGEYVAMRRVDMGIDELKPGSMVEPQQNGEQAEAFGAGLADDRDPLSYTEVHHPEALKAMQQTVAR